LGGVLRRAHTDFPLQFALQAISINDHGNVSLGGTVTCLARPLYRDRAALVGSEKPEGIVSRFRLVLEDEYLVIRVTLVFAGMVCIE